MTTRRTVRIGEREWTASVEAGGATLDGVETPFGVESEPDGRARITHGGDTLVGVAAVSGDTVWVSVDGHVMPFTIGAADSRTRPKASSRSRSGEAILPPMSATVVRILVKPGDAVHAGDTLIVLEAMKMELPIRAPHDGVVGAVRCREGELVQPETVLIDLA